MTAFNSDTPLEVRIEKKPDGTCVITPEGRIDSETYTQLEDKIKPCLMQDVKSIIFDMTDLSYISSAGLVVIFNAKKFVEAKNGKVVLTNLQPQIKKVFEVIKALPPQNIFESVEEADRYLSAIQKQEIRKQKGEI